MNKEGDYSPSFKLHVMIINCIIVTSKPELSFIPIGLLKRTLGDIRPIYYRINGGPNKVQIISVKDADKTRHLGLNGQYIELEVNPIGCDLTQGDMLTPYENKTILRVQQIIKL